MKGLVTARIQLKSATWFRKPLFYSSLEHYENLFLDSAHYKWAHGLFMVGPANLTSQPSFSLDHLLH